MAAIDFLYITGFVFLFMSASNLRFGFANRNKVSTKIYSKILAAFFILLAICNGFFYIVSYGLIVYIPFTFKVFMPVSLLIPVLGYLFVDKILGNIDRWVKKDLLHLIPFVIITLNYLTFYFMGFEEKRILIESVVNDLTGLITIDYKGFLKEETVFLIQITISFFYMFLSWRSFFKKKKGFRLLRSKNEEIFKWVKTFIILKTVFYIMLPVSMFSSRFLIFEDDSNIIALVIVHLFTISFVILSAYLLLNPKLFNVITIHNVVVLKKLKVSLTEISINIISKKKYFGSDLTLKMLADSLEIDQTDITDAIVTSEHTNYKDFINSVRLNEMIINMNHPIYIDKTIYGIAQDFGFNSESTFHRVFKKNYKLTPKEYFSKPDNK